jgi:hypothetical protein
MYKLGMELLKMNLFYDHFNTGILAVVLLGCSEV